MLPCEFKWKNSQLADLASFAETYDVFCNRPRPRPKKNPAAAVHDMRTACKRFFLSPNPASVPYLLARNWQKYVIESCGDYYPLWLHANDIPTMQAAHGGNPDLGAYLRDRAKSWSSNYIASDLRIDVWAARVCLDLYGVRTPCRAGKPRNGTQGEATFTHDGAQVQTWLQSGYTVDEIATELGVTEGWLRRKWLELGIDPQSGRRVDRSFGPARDDNSSITEGRDAWVCALRNGVEDTHPNGRPCRRNVESVGDASRVWGTTSQTARARLLTLGWKPYTSVATSLDLRRSFQEMNGWTGIIAEPQPIEWNAPGVPASSPEDENDEEEVLVVPAGPYVGYIAKQDPNRYERWRAELREAGAQTEQDAKKAWQTDLITAREMLKELGWEPGMPISEILA
jgi:hypothetical protein